MAATGATLFAITPSTTPTRPSAALLPRPLWSTKSRRPQRLASARVRCSAKPAGASRKENTRMRNVTSYLFISLDGVVEAPDTFVRSDLYEDFDPLTAEMIAEQDAVLLGRKTYNEWSVFWPQSTIEPF